MPMYGVPVIKRRKTNLIAYVWGPSDMRPTEKAVEAYIQSWDKEKGVAVWTKGVKTVHRRWEESVFGKQKLAIPCQIFPTLKKKKLSLESSLLVLVL